MSIKKEEILLRIKKETLVAVVRGNCKQDAVNIAKKCIAGGFCCIEITFTTPLAHLAIEELKAEYGDPIIVGAGTVLDSETARIAMLHGAQFIVSPHYSEEVIRTCNRYRVAVMSGIMTITEAVSALEAGCDMLKVFPSEVLGIGFIKAMKAPLPQAELMPTGGVTIENIADWLNAGVVAVGIGGSLTKGDITANATAFVKAVKQYKGE